MRFRPSLPLAFILVLLLLLPTPRVLADMADPIPYAWSDTLQPDKVEKLTAAYLAAAQKSPANVSFRIHACRLLFVSWRLEKTDQRKRLDYAKLIVKQAKEMVEHKPDRAEGYHWLGAGIGMVGLSRGVLNSLQLVPQIRSNLEKSAALDPNYLDASALLQLGRMYTVLPGFPLSVGDKRRAMEYILDSKKRASNFTLTNLYLADLLWALGKNDEAIAEIEKIPAMKPKNEVEYFTYEVNKKKGQELLELIRSGTKREPFYDVLSDIQPGIVD